MLLFIVDLYITVKFLDSAGFILAMQNMLDLV